MIISIVTSIFSWCPGITRVLPFSMNITFFTRIPLVGDLSLKKQESLELSLERYFVNIGCNPFTDVWCAFCGKKFHLEREILKHLNLTNWSSMLEFIQKRSHIIVKSVSASLGLNITYIVIEEGNIAVLSRENHLLITKNSSGNYWRTKQLDITQWRVIFVITLPMVLPA